MLFLTGEGASFEELLEFSLILCWRVCLFENVPTAEVTLALVKDA